MNKFTSNFILKLMAFIIVAACSVISVISLTSIIYLSGAGGYDGISSYSQTSDAKARAGITAKNVVLFYLNSDSKGLDGSNNIFGREECNLAVAIYEQETDQLIYRNFAFEDSNLQGSGYYYGEGDEGYYEEYFIKDSNPKYRIEYALSMDISAKDDFYYCDTLYRVQYQNRYALIYIAMVSIALMYATIVFLFCGAGRAAGKPGITLSWIDRIPLDLYTVVAAVVLAYCIYLIYTRGFPTVQINFYERGYYYGFAHASIITYVMILCGVVAPFILFFLIYFLSIAARIKYGKWYENTLIFRFGKKLLLIMQSAGYFPTAAIGIIIFWILFYFLYQTEMYVLLVILIFIYTFLIFWWLYESAMLKRAINKYANEENEYTLDSSKFSSYFKMQANDLHRIKWAAEQAAQRSIRSEHLQSELITNVSHDIKTPLTSIINYVNLLQHVKDPEQSQKYLNVLQKQANKLKKLTEDLVEASKASTGNITVNMMPSDLRELLDQAIGEYQERFEAGRLEIVLDIQENARSVIADGRLLWRVFSNLFSNLVKYAQPDTRVYISTVRTIDGNIMISIKNVSRDALNISAEELTQRFVRGDQSRHTEGSGLGLNIVQNLVELQQGYFNIVIDGDLFRANIILAAKPESNKE